jgi:GUN4-like
MMAKESDLSYSKLMDEILNVPLRSAKGIDYRKLRDLLKAGNWHDADMETESTMLQATNREHWVDYDSLRNFPCQDLKTIDALWVAASNGHFGFSVQQRIWAECGSPIVMLESNWQTFCLTVGWFDRSTGEHTGFSALKMNLATSPIGEMPVFGSGCDREDVKSADYFGFAFLAQRLVECSLQPL